MVARQRQRATAAKPGKGGSKKGAGGAASRFTGPATMPLNKAAKKAGAAAVKEAAREGLILLADDKWTSGYFSVLVDKSTEGLRNRFRVQKRTPEGRRVTIGRFGSAEEAALCYARSDAGKEELSKRERQATPLAVEGEPLALRAGAAAPRVVFTGTGKRITACSPGRACFAAKAAPACAQSKEAGAEAVKTPKPKNRGRAVLDTLAVQYQDHRTGPPQQHKGKKQAAAGARAKSCDAPKSQCKIRRTTPVKATGAAATVSPVFSRVTVVGPLSPRGLSPRAGPATRRASFSVADWRAEDDWLDLDAIISMMEGSPDK